VVDGAAVEVVTDATGTESGCAIVVAGVVVLAFTLDAGAADAAEVDDDTELAVAADEAGLSSVTGLLALPLLSFLRAT
jgi:hypothetical protein